MIKLRGITWDHPRGYEPLNASVRPYFEKYGVSVTWETRSLKDFGDVPINTLAKDYDLLIIDHPHVGLAAKFDCLLPLDLYLERQMLNTLADQSAGPSHASYFYDGHQWALAIDAAMQTSAYRADLLDGELPDSWQDTISFGKALAESRRSIAIPLCSTDAICSFLTVYASLGGLLGQGDAFIDTAAGRQALEILFELCQISHPDSLNWNPIQLLDYMSQHGDVVYCPLTFSYSNYARTGYAPHVVHFHDIPGIKGSLLGGAGIAVSTNCVSPEAACAYSAWICSAEIQRTLYLANGGQPGNSTVWNDPIANEITHRFFADSYQTLQHSYMRPRHSGFVTFQEGAGNLINTALRRQQSVDDCLHRLLDLYQSMLHTTTGAA